MSIYKGKDLIADLSSNLSGIESLIDTAVNNKFKELYKIGDILINTSGTSPAGQFGGTWENYAKGMTLIGVDTSDVDFNIVNKTGGSKTVTLNVSELPSHNHNVSITSSGGGTSGSTTPTDTGSTTASNTGSTSVTIDSFIVSIGSTTPDNVGSTTPSNVASTTPAATGSTTPGATGAPSNNTTSTPTASGAGITLSAASAGAHQHGIYYTSDASSGGTLARLNYNSTVLSPTSIMTSVGAHTHTIQNHDHNMNSHTHTSAAHTHTSTGHDHTSAAHTHTSAAHTHTSAAHTHTNTGHVHSIPTHTHTSAAHTHTTPSHIHTLSQDNIGSNQPHNNLSPYCTVYFWRKIG